MALPPPEVEAEAAVVVVIVKVFPVNKVIINSALNSACGIPPMGPATQEKVTKAPSAAP